MISYQVCSSLETGPFPSPVRACSVRAIITRGTFPSNTPLGTEPEACTLLEGEKDPVNPILFDSLDADAIRQAAMHTQGAAGPSVLDAISMLGEGYALPSNLPPTTSVGPSLTSDDVLQPVRSTLMALLHL